MQGKIKYKIFKEQCGFIEDVGTRNATFMLRMLRERDVELRRDLYVCFLGYAKAFDKVSHEEMLQNLGKEGKDIQLIWNVYWEQTAAVRINNEVSQFKNYTR